WPGRAVWSKPVEGRRPRKKRNGRTTGKSGQARRYLLCAELIMHKRWIYKPIATHEEIERLSTLININSYLSAVLLQRGVEDFESARKFFRPSLDQLHDPFLMTDMRPAVERIHKAISHGEKIL